MSLFFLDAEHGWAYGGGTVAWTVDGGLHWTRQHTGASLRRTCLTFADARHGWMVDYEGGILVTENGGHATAPDAVAPTTTARAGSTYASLLEHWTNKPVKVTFNAVDDPGGWGVSSTQYRVDDAAGWTTGISMTVAAPADHSNDGIRTIAYRSTDIAGNVEADQTCHIMIDTRAPRPRVLAPVSVFRGGVATVRYTVADALPNGGRARVAIVVKNDAGATVARVASTTVDLNQESSAAFTCSLTRGVYRIVITARDTAGNQQLKAGSGQLTVK
jgi:hypothetical protein